MPSYTKRAAQWLTEMIARVTARSTLSDVAESSGLLHLLSAVSVALEGLSFQVERVKDLFSIDTASGSDLDARALDYPVGQLTRIPAAKAVCASVVLSRPGVVGVTTVAAGSKIKGPDGQTYTITDTATINAASPEQVAGHGIGRDSGLLGAIADVAGEDGNIPANTIVGFVSTPSGVNEATNLSAFTGGEDKESDDAFRQRIKLFINSLARCHVSALEFAVLGVTDEDTGASIRYSKAIEDIVLRGLVTLYIDDGTGTAEDTEPVLAENLCEGFAGPPADTAVGGETDLYTDYKPIKDDLVLELTHSVTGVLVRNVDYTINLASGKIVLAVALANTEFVTADYTRYTGLVEAAQRVVDGDPDDRLTYPGYRAAGVLVLVDVPTVMIQTVTATATVKDGYTATTVKAAVKTAAIDYINSLGISDDVVRHELIKRMMSVPGVYDVTVTAPAANVAILDSELARTTSVNVTVA